MHFTFKAWQSFIIYFLLKWFQFLREVFLLETELDNRLYKKKCILLKKPNGKWNCCFFSSIQMALHLTVTDKFFLYRTLL